MGTVLPLLVLGTVVFSQKFFFFLRSPLLEVLCPDVSSTFSFFQDVNVRSAVSAVQQSIFIPLREDNCDEIES